MLESIRIQGETITPLLTFADAQGKNFVGGEDAQGEFIACKLANESWAKLSNWYVLVSPEDVALMQTHYWYGNLSGKEVNKHVVIRRRFTDCNGSQQDVALNHEIWERMTGNRVPRVFLQGNPFDFRRHNLGVHATRKFLHKLCQGVTMRPSGAQVQIYVHGKYEYVGIVRNAEEGYRMYNHRLRELKSEFPRDARIQRMTFNQVEPMF